MAQAVDSVLRRKLDTTGVPAGDQSSGSRAVRLSLARAAQEVLALPMRVEALSQSRRSLTEVLEALPGQGLIIILEGPEEGLGLMSLSPAVMAALVEKQATGRVSRADPPVRKPTRTDAAMCAEFIERSLRELEEELAEDDALVWAGGFRYASFLDDPRPLGLLLEETSYRLFLADVDLAEGAKAGRILLALPADGRGRRPKPGTNAAAAPSQDDKQAWKQSLREAVMGAETRLDAVLCRITIPLSAVLALKPGDQVPVPISALERIVLETEDGRRLAEGRLGQHRGERALRLTQAPEPAVQVIKNTPQTASNAPLSSADGG